MDTPVGRVRLVDLDDRDAVAGVAVGAWSPDDPVTIGFTTDPSPEHDRVLSRMTTTLVPLAAGPVDRRVVPVPDPEGIAEQLLEQVHRWPAACWTLDGLLRVVADVDAVETGLVAESLAYSTLLAGREFAGWLGQQRAYRVRHPSSPPVRLSRDGEHLTVELCDPDRRNALSAALRAALVEGLELPRQDGTITRVELTGAGPCFSSGGDLAEFGSVTDPPSGHGIRLQSSPGLGVHRIADRVVARVHGPCVGAGVELPAFAARVVAAPGTTFRLPEIAMGLVPGAGGTVSLTRRIGRWRTAYLCLSAVALDTDVALEWGLVDAVG